MSYKMLTTIRSSGLRCVLSRYYSSLTKVEKLDPTFVDEKPLFEDPKHTEEELIKVRSKSRLKPEDRNVLQGKPPYEAEMHYAHGTIKYKKKMLGRYGLDAVNVNPGICWPSKKDIEDRKEYEKVAYPHELREAWKILADQRKAEKEAILARDEEVHKNMQKVTKWKKDLEDKLLKKEMELQKAKQRRERLIEEVRQHFGFKIDPKDQRFKELMDQKEKEEAKKRKAAKKEEKMKRYLLKMAGQDTTEGEQVKQQSPTEEKDK